MSLRTLRCSFECSLLTLLFLSQATRLLAQESNEERALAGNKKVAEIFRTFQGRGVQSDGSEPTAPADALRQFDMRDGFGVDLVAAEPAISQPLFLSWDSRGRMWVVQYRQYQYPAGLKVVRFDHHLRAVFDKTPQPPPHGVPGADKVTVFEDTNGDGFYDVSKDVLQGLNIVSSVQVGHGGIWVLNPPYLLFYPDANRDDVPDGDPQVRLSGFGLQDTHSVANSLLWGPDGWLYGANGSTTGGTVSSATTKGVTFQGQCIWRYHPDSDRFEIYAEGGGNTFSCEIDSTGRVFSGTNGGGTRGFYYPQGTYFHKNWGKHGPLTNPYAFGFFQPMKSEGDSRRFPQAFLIYEGGRFADSFTRTIVAPNAMCNLVWNSRLIPDGSYYRTVDEANLMTSSDRWFRPVYAGVGPDGCVYLADWYDTRLSHVSPTDDWHKESGRVYRIRPADADPQSGNGPTYSAGDLHQADSDELLTLFDHTNKWVRQRATLELGWRADTAIASKLAAKVEDAGSLESLWTLNMMGELSTTQAVEWMQHEDANIRRWAVRLLGDRHEGHAAMATLARDEVDVQVRSQLASTAKRIDASHGLAIVAALIGRDEDVADPLMPLQVWWAFEAHADAWSQVEQLLADREIWQKPMMKSTLIERLMQRYAAAGSPVDLQHCGQLVELAPDNASRELLVQGLNKAFQGRTLPALPSSVNAALEAYRTARGSNGMVLALKQGNEDAIEPAIKALRDASLDLGVRIEIAAAFGQTSGDAKYAAAVEPLLRLATARDTNEPAFQRVAIRALSAFSDDRIAKTIANGFDSPISAEHSLRATGCRTLASRASWAKVLLDEVNQWRLKKSEVPPDVIQQLRTYDDPQIVSAVQQAFGPEVQISSPEKIAELERLSKMLAAWDGDERAGQVVFEKKCATCHQLFGKGDHVGPPLDSYDRGNLKFWLPAIVEPSLEIREGYQSYVATTTGGRIVVGMIAEQNPNAVTIRTSDLQKVVLPRSELDELKAIRTSLMPADLLNQLSDQQIKDLLAYMSIGAKRQ